MPESTRKMHRTGYTLTTEMLTCASASLTEIDWRLLHWLLRYPLQRADDLVVGVARWASRATVYRHLQGLEANGLVESVLPKTLGTGKRLYHLSNLGLHILALSLETLACELARRWQADEAGLLLRLARLPTLLFLQDLVNGLVTGATDAMTTRGRRPQLIRWTWQRDVIHSFQYREQTLRFFADGSVALCIRPQQGEFGSLDQWYGLFLLFTELNDERLMRLRLERLLCWRESPERWPAYQYMLPVMILASSSRQREHWQYAIEATSLKLRLEPLAGAVATLPLSERTHLNPWLLNWQALDTEEPCRLRELLKPLPLVAFPSSQTLQPRVDERDGHLHPSGACAVQPPSTGIPARLRRLIVGNLARRAASSLSDKPVEKEMIALLGLQLTPGHWRVLYLLQDHPLMSDRDLAAFLARQRESARTFLYTLHCLGCLDSIPTEVGTRWLLSERGLRLICAANHFHIRNLAVVSVDETGAGAPIVKPRGVDWLLEHIQHTAGIYRFFAALAEAARRVPEHELCWWETGAMCERRYQVGEQWHNLRPDALAAYRVGSKQFRFWLEWDRGTMNSRDLAIKFASYAQYIDSREWARESTTLPWLICVAPDIAQERRVQRVAQVALSRLPGLMVWTTTEVLLGERGPLAPIWSVGLLSRGQAAPSRSLRRPIFHILSEKDVKRDVFVSEGEKEDK